MLLWFASLTLSRSHCCSFHFLLAWWQSFYYQNMFLSRSTWNVMFWLAVHHGSVEKRLFLLNLFSLRNDFQLLKGSWINVVTSVQSLETSCCPVSYNLAPKWLLNFQIIHDPMFLCLWFSLMLLLSSPQKLIHVMIFQLLNRSRANLLPSRLISSEPQSIITCHLQNSSTLKLFTSRCCDVFGFLWGSCCLVPQKLIALMICQLLNF